MPKITVLPHELAPEGAELNVPVGTSICEALLTTHRDRTCLRHELCLHDLPLHRAQGFDSLNEVEECEDDLLDRAWG